MAGLNDMIIPSMRHSTVNIISNEFSDVMYASNRQKRTWDALRLLRHCCSDTSGCLPVVAWPPARGRLILDQDMIMQCYLQAPYVAMQQQTLQNDKEVFFFILTKGNNSHFILISNVQHYIINGNNSIMSLTFRSLFKAVNFTNLSRPKFCDNS
jgi:hypothetical protein